MKLINYKDSHFDLIIDKEHPLYPKTDVKKVINREKCKHCKATFIEQNKMRDHMKKLHGDKLEKNEVASKEETVEILRKKVKLLETE